MDQQYIRVCEDEYPGMVLQGDRAYYEVSGNLVPVEGMVWSNSANQYVPVIDLPMLEEK